MQPSQHRGVSRSQHLRLFVLLSAYELRSVAHRAVSSPRVGHVRREASPSELSPLGSPCRPLFLVKHEYHTCIERARPPELLSLVSNTIRGHETQESKC